MLVWVVGLVRRLVVGSTEIKTISTSADIYLTDNFFLSKGADQKLEKGRRGKEDQGNRGSKSAEIDISVKDHFVTLLFIYM